MVFISNWVCAFLAVGALVCGCSAQAQSEMSGGFTQDMIPRDSKTCSEIRYNLELMLYNTYKGSIPRLMLKEVLPGLVEPLMPAACVGSGSHVKWLQETAAATPEQISRLKRQVGGFFTPPMNIKDPGDHPPPGMMGNPMKDPGDRPAGMVTVPMTGALGLGRQWNRPSAGFDIFAKPFRGRYYGDQLPHGRRKRSAEMAEEEEDSEVDFPHLRRRRANGEEEKKDFDPFSFFFDRSDQRKSSSSSSFMFPFRLFNTFFNMQQQPRRSSFSSVGRRGNNGNGRLSYNQRNQFGPRPNTFFGNSPTWRQSNTMRQAPVRSQGFSPVRSQAPAPMAQPAIVRSPTAPVAWPAASTSSQARPNVVQPNFLFPGLQALMGPSQSLSAAAPLSPVRAPPLSPSPSLPAGPVPSPSPALSPSPSLAPAPAAFVAPSPSMPTSPAIPPAPSPPMLQPSAPQPPPTTGQGGVIFGDRMPSYGVSSTTNRRRVKRASDNSSPSDMVTFGDFSMPADTFKKLVNPRASKSDDVTYNDRRVYYSRPPVRGPVYSPRGGYYTNGPPPPVYNYNPPMYNRNYLARRTMAQKRYGMYQPSQYSGMSHYNQPARQAALLNRQQAALINRQQSSFFNRQQPALLNSQAAQQQAALMSQPPMSMAMTNAISPMANSAGMATQAQAGLPAPLPMGAAMPPIFGNFPAF